MKSIGEAKEFCILYYDFCKLKVRRYYPDFLVENKLIVEIKPKAWWYKNEVPYKAFSAIGFATEKNLGYKILDFKTNIKDIQEEFKSGNIKFHMKSSPNFDRFMRKLNK